jgi:exosortase D (VPLPA-CTERM-specific)
MMSIQSIKKLSSGLSSLALPAVATLAVGVVGFGGVLLELVRRWNQQEEYSHGFLIPIVTAWLLWTRRDALRESIGPPSFAGLGVVVFAITMHMLGELSDIFILSQVGFVLALMGIVLAIGGYTLLRVAFIPITYLLFAIPMPYFIDAKLTLQLQLISSQLGVFFIQLFQIPVYLDGNIIDMGNYQLQVAEACSGLRYLYPLLSIGFLAAYLFHAPLWQRTMIFLSSIPIAVGMNGFRIGVIGFLVDRWGPAMAEGALHFFEGWVVFLACSALLAGEVGVLASVSGRRFFDVFHLPTVTAVPPDGIPTKSPRRGPVMACLSVLCLAGLGVFFISGRSEIIPERTRFAAFPMSIGEWQGRVMSFDSVTEQIIKTDDYIMANYIRSGDKPVNLYVAYYASQRKNESPHSPIVCLPGGGWLITQLGRQTFNSDGIERPYNRVVIQNGSVRELVYYWFDERGRAVADEYMAKWYLLADSIVKNRSDGALVRLTTEIKSESEESADRRLRSFMQVTLPRLNGFLPSTTASQSVGSALLRSTRRPS